MQADGEFRRGRMSAAMRLYERALAAGLRHPAVLNNYAYVAMAGGQAGKVATLRRYGIREMHLEVAYSTYLCSRLYVVESPAALWKEHRIAGTLTKGGGGRRGPSGARVRVGYVSGCYREHSILWFLLPILEAQDRERYEVFLYATSGQRDAWTEVVAGRAEHWRDVSGMNNEQAARAIRADAIDVLVDLDGHFGGNRIGVFRQRPAPIAVSYLGYPCTTGLGEMDYRISDGIADPMEERGRYHSERLERLEGGFLCFGPPKGDVWVDCKRTGGGKVVYGCFGSLPKITNGTLRSWRQILDGVPGAVVHLKAEGLLDAETRRIFSKRLARAELGEGEVVMLEFEALRRKHLERYRSVDVALDTFPYNGTTTTCEALWMGVPVVTRRGRTHHSRVGASVLTAVGRPDLIAETEEGYVGAAIELGRKVVELRKGRRALRKQVERSRLCDARAFTRDLEACFARWTEGVS